MDRRPYGTLILAVLLGVGMTPDGSARTPHPAPSPVDEQFLDQIERSLRPAASEGGASLAFILRKPIIVVRLVNPTGTRFD